MLPAARCENPRARLACQELVLERLSSAPGVQSASLVSDVPYSNGGGLPTDVFSIGGRPPAQRGERIEAIIETITPNYFGVLKIALRDGRLLTEADGAEAIPVAVISESLARRYFPNTNPLR